MTALLPRLIQPRSNINPRNSLESYLDLETSSRAASPISGASTPVNSYFFFVPDGMRPALYRTAPSYDAADDLPRGSSRIASGDAVMVVPPANSRSFSPFAPAADDSSLLRFPTEATARTTWNTAEKPLANAPSEQAAPRLNLTFSALSFGSFRIQSPTDELTSGHPAQLYFGTGSAQRHASAITHGSRQRSITTGTASFLDFDKDIDSSDAGTARRRSATDIEEDQRVQQSPAQHQEPPYLVSPRRAPLPSSSFLLAGEPDSSPALTSILLSQARPHYDYIQSGIMPTALPTFLSLGGESLGKGKSGTVAEAPAASAYSSSRHDAISPTKSLWASMRGKKTRQHQHQTSDGYAPLDRYQSPTRIQTQPPVSHGFYGVDTTFTPAGKINLGYAFPSPSANGSQQTLRQQKSFLNLSTMQSVPGREAPQGTFSPSASRPGNSLEGSPWSIDSAGHTISRDYAQPQGLPSSVSAPHSLAAYLQESRLRPSESTPDLRIQGLEGVTRRPSAATTDDAKLRRPAPPIPAAQHIHHQHTPPVALRQQSHLRPKAPPSAGPTTSSQVHPVASRWKSATACDQFVLPRPRLVAHVVSPPGSPEKEEKVVLISRDADAQALVPGEAIKPPANPLQAVEQREIEREQWSAYSKGKRSLSFSTAPALTRETISSTPKTSWESRPSKPRSRASSFSQLFRRMSSQDDRPARARTNSFGSSNAKSFGFLHSHQREDAALHTRPDDSRPLFKAPVRQRERAPSQDRWQTNYGYARTPTGLPASASSPNLLQAGMRTGALMEKQDDQAVVIIGRPNLTSASIRNPLQTSNKALPALPSEKPSTRQERPAPLNLAQDRQDESAADLPALPAHIVAGFVSAPRTDDGEFARRELERAHQRQLAQRAFLPVRVKRAAPQAMPSPALNRKFSNEAMASRDNAPEPLPLATALALASRAASPRRKKTSIEEAVSRARTNEARSPLSPAFSGPSVYSHRRQHSDAGSDHTSILEAAGIIASPTFQPGHRATASQPPLLGAPISSPPAASPAPRQLEYLKQSARQVEGSPVSQSSSHGSPMPNLMSDEPESFQDLFFAKPSREWGSPLPSHASHGGTSRGHARSSSAPNGHLSGLGFDAASAEDVDADGERFEIHVATPVDDDALHEVVNPGPATLSGELDPRRVLDQNDEQTETLGRQLSALFSEESPELSGRSDNADSSPEKEVDRQLDWRNTLLRSESDTPIRVGNVSSGNLDPPTAYFARHVKGRQSTSSVIPELGTQPCSESLSKHVSNVTEKHASGATEDDPSRYSFVQKFPCPPASPQRGPADARAPARTESDLRHLNLHALALDGEGEEGEYDGEEAEHLRSPVRPGNARMGTQTTVAESFVTATEGYSASESGL